MKNIAQYLLICIICMLSTTALSQEIEGLVFDQETNRPIEGASVYFDNTTIGTTTNIHGEFSLTKIKDLKTNLIIHHMGYETYTLSLDKINGTFKINLNPSYIELEEVIVSADDDWPRELKLREFKKQYLGVSENGKYCQVVNEEDLILTYSIKYKKLTARSKKPIKINNARLKYLIMTDLKNFTVRYRKVSKNKKHLDVLGVFYQGSNRYQNYDTLKLQATQILRKEAYGGSVLHFMRALSRGELPQKGYEITVNGLITDPKECFTIVPTRVYGQKKVNVPGKFQVIYQHRRVSAIVVSDKYFLIDAFGNHSPIKSVKFGGDFGDERMGDALPLDFLMETNAM